MRAGCALADIEKRVIDQSNNDTEDLDDTDNLATASSPIEEADEPTDVADDHHPDADEAA
jgi:hypothetical protein